MVHLNFYRLAFWLSVVYLIAIGLPFIFLIPYSSNPEAELELSKLWLLPVQALVVSALSVVFFTQTEDE